MGTYYLNTLGTDGVNNAHVSADLSTPAKHASSPDLTDWAKGDKIWIGIKLSCNNCTKDPIAETLYIQVRKDGGSWLSLALSDLAPPGSGQMQYTDLTPPNSAWWTANDTGLCSTNEADGGAADAGDSVALNVGTDGKAEAWWAIDFAGAANESLYEFGFYDASGNFGSAGSPTVLDVSVTIAAAAADRNISIDDEEATITVTDVPTVALPDSLEINISEPLITVTDVPEMAQESFISISEPVITVVDVLDDIVCYQETLEVNIAEPLITVTDVVVDLAFELVPSVFDGVTVLEDVTVVLPDALEVNVFETAISVTEDVTVDVQEAAVEDLDINVYDEVTVTDVVEHIGVSNKWWTDFSEYAIGVPGDWTERWDIAGTVSEIIASSDKISDKELFLDYSSGGETAMSWDDIGTPRNIEILALYTVKSNNSHCFVLRGGGSQGSEDGYYFYGSASMNFIYLQKLVGGSSSSLDSAARSYSIGSTFWIRFQAIGDQIKVKIWGWSASEPGGWNLEATDNSLTEGWAGAMHRGIDDAGCLLFSVATYGETPHVPYRLVSEEETITVTDVGTCETWCPWDQDFIGSDDDPPDPSIWTEDDPNSKMSIQSNELYFDDSGALDTYGQVQSKFMLVGDFDIEINYDVDVMDQASSGDTQAVRLSVMSADDGSYVSIMRARSVVSNGFVYVGTSDAWTWYTGYQLDSNGKLRLQRIGSTLKCWYWHAGNARWEWAGGTTGYTFTTSFSDDCFIRLRFAHSNSKVLQAGIIDLKINDACGEIVWYDIPVNVFETVTVTDEETVEVEVEEAFEINVFDTTAVTEDVTVVLPDALEISVFDTTTVTDEETVAVISPEDYTISVFDTTGVTEDVTVELPDSLIISVFDTTTVTEYIDLAQELVISVFDETTVTDEETVQVEAGPALDVSVYDAVTVTDEPIPVCYVADQDGILAVTGEFESPTTTGEQRIAHGLGETPALVILFTSMVEYGSTSRDNACLSHGAMDSNGNEMTGGFRSDDAADPTDNSSWQFNNKVIFMQDTEGATQLDAECGATSWDGDFFYIDWNTVDSTRYRISFVAIARITAKVGTFTQQASTGTQDVSIGFQPDVIMFQGGAVDVNTPQADIRHFFGQANNNEDCNTMSVHMEDNVGTTDCEYWAGTTVSNMCIMRIDDTSWSTYALDEADISNISGWPSDGFELNWAVNNGDEIPIGYIAIAGVESFIDYDTEPTGTPPQDLAVTGAGFQGELLIIHTPGYSWGGVTAHAYVSVGYARTPQYEVACAIRDEHAQSAADCSVTHRNNRVFEKLKAQSTSIRASAEFKSWDADGFTLTFQTTTDITATVFQFMVLKRREFQISEFETVTVTESVAVLLPDALELSEYEEVTVTDIAFINVVLHPSVFDSVGVDEDVTVYLEDFISAFDSTTVTEDVTVELPDALLIDVFDGSGVTDFPTVSVSVVGEYNISVFDGVTVEEQATVQLPDPLAITVFDIITVAEFADAYISDYYVTVSDLVTVSELVEVAPQLKISIFDTITVTDIGTAALSALAISVFDSTSVTDVVSFFIPNYGINIFETVTVGESVTAITSELNASTFDVVTVTDVVVIYWVLAAGLTTLEITERAPDIEFLARIPEIEYDERRPRIDFEVRS